MATLTPDSWKRLRFLLDRAMELDEAQLGPWLDSLEGEERSVRAELARMLSQHEQLKQRPSLNAADLAIPVLSDELRDAMELDRARVGQIIGPYRLICLLGAGGMGVVYLAEHSAEGFSRQVALKVVRNALGGAAAHERFERERKILASLKHPGIALLFDGGHTPDGQAFYTMEYVDGRIVTDHCRIQSSSVPTRVRILLQIASALACAHQNLIVHRDIKPSNVLVDSTGQVKLVDFGLAKLVDQRLEPTMTLGGAGPMTPAYAAPEQLRNSPVTVATDIYQFGVLCFVVLTGRLPYRADPTDSVAWTRAVSEEEPITLMRALDTGDETPSTAPNPKYQRQLTRDLDAIIRKALAKEPSERYASMDAMMVDLEAFLAGRPVAARRAGAAYFAWRFVLRHRYAALSSVAAFVALVATALIAVRQSHIAVAEATRANNVADFVVGLFRVSDPAVNRGEHLNANQILEQATERIDRQMASQPEQRARLQLVIGEVYTNLGDYPRAKSVLDTAIATFKGLPAPDPIDLAYALSRRAFLTSIQGDLSAALEMLNQSESMLDGSTPRQKDELSTLHSRRASILDRLGKYELARSEYGKALELREQIGQDRTLKTAGLHNNFGNLLRSMNDLKSAQREYTAALDIDRENYGHESGKDLLVIGTEMNLGIVLIDLDDLTRARELLQRASDFFAGMDVNVNLGYANAEDKLGEVDRLERKFEAALAHYANSEHAYRVVLGDHHSSLALPIQNRGQAELERGDFDAALTEFERALTLRLETLPRTRREVATSLDGRGQALLGLKRYDEARTNAEEALAIWRGALPASHPLIVYSLYHVGLIRYAQGDREGAQNVWQEALAKAPLALIGNTARLDQVRKAIDVHDTSLLDPLPAGSYDQ